MVEYCCEITVPRNECVKVRLYCVFTGHETNDTREAISKAGF